MEDIQISSGLIKTIGYISGVLHVELQNGDKLSYQNIPFELFDIFRTTTEPDRFYKGIIQNHLCRRVE